MAEKHSHTSPPAQLVQIRLGLMVHDLTLEPLKIHSLRCEQSDGTLNSVRDSISLSDNGREDEPGVAALCLAILKLAVLAEDLPLDRVVHLWKGGCNTPADSLYGAFKNRALWLRELFGSPDNLETAIKKIFNAHVRGGSRTATRYGNFFVEAFRAEDCLEDELQVKKARLSRKMLTHWEGRECARQILERIGDLRPKNQMREKNWEFTDQAEWLPPPLKEGEDPQKEIAPQEGSQWYSKKPAIDQFKSNEHPIWRSAKRAYRTSIEERWIDKWSNLKQIEPMEGDHRPRFIMDQGIQQLIPGNEKIGKRILRHLKPYAFVVSRDTETEARYDTGDWKSLKDVESARDDNDWRAFFADRICKGKAARDRSDSLLSSLHRVFIVSAGGIGKSATLEWLEYELNRSDSYRLAFRFSPEDFRNFHRDESPRIQWEKLKELIAEKFLNTSKVDLTNETAEGSLDNEIKENGIVLLIDGLDHLQERTLRFLLDAQENRGDWAKISIVLSGRPYVLSDWVEESPTQSKQLNAVCWQFFRLEEFNEEQQKLYLGTAKDGCPKIEMIPAQARRILSSPRVLSYILGMKEDRLSKLYTPSDVYYESACGSLGETLSDGSGPPFRPANMIGINHWPDSKLADLGGHHPLILPEDQIPYVMGLLGAIAFEMTKKMVGKDKSRRSQSGIDENVAADKSQGDQLDIDENVITNTYLRVKHLGYDFGETDSRLRTHVVTDIRKGLHQISTIVSNGLLEPPPRGSHEITSIIWANKDIRCFFVAYWLASHAYTAFPTDTETFKDLVFFHESINDDFYVINSFLVDMPKKAIKHDGAKCWTAAAAHWFRRPSGNHFARPSEMMYRAWPRLTSLAEEPWKDWWNVSYEKLLQGAASKKIPRQYDCSDISNDHSRELAASILRDFRNEFQEILDHIDETLESKEMGIAAKEFISRSMWCEIPSGEFEMGASPEAQGFPPKTKAYWKSICDSVVREISSAGAGGGKEFAASVAAKYADICNDPKWFTGAQGRRFRREDVDWLTQILFKLALADTRRTQMPSPATSERLERRYSKTLQSIENYWRRRDETPVEKLQKVSAFEIQKYPLLHRWFWLFAPRHRESVEHYLKEIKSENKAESHPGDDHPVIYVSWFDAWAFCQWARWKDPESGVQFACRLPYEPEWEFAVRKSPCDGEITNTSYWWGDSYYENELDDEMKVDPKWLHHAHSNGDPGRTGNPALSLPNGFGLHDMLGNVWEWSANKYFDRGKGDSNRYGYSRNEPASPDEVGVNSYRTMRGGIWYFRDLLSYCTHRFRLESSDRDYKMGFRVVRYPISD